MPTKRKANTALRAADDVKNVQPGRPSDIKTIDWVGFPEGMAYCRIPSHLIKSSACTICGCKEDCVITDTLIEADGGLRVSTLETIAKKHGCVRLSLTPFKEPTITCSKCLCLATGQFPGKYTEKNWVAYKPHDLLRIHEFKAFEAKVVRVPKQMNDTTVKAIPHVIHGQYVYRLAGIGKTSFELVRVERPHTPGDWCLRSDKAEVLCLLSNGIGLVSVALSELFQIVTSASAAASATATAPTTAAASATSTSSSFTPASAAATAPAVASAVATTATATASATFSTKRVRPPVPLFDATEKPQNNTAAKQI